MKLRVPNIINISKKIEKHPDPPRQITEPKVEQKEKKVQGIDKKLILLAKAYNIIKRPTRWKCNAGRAHIQENLDWLEEYEKEILQ